MFLGTASDYNSVLRMLTDITGSEATGAKIRGREGNNPE